ncbi:MAG: DUF998 domain-containing protein [Candidatus Hodarchaeota archaeon]
MNIVAKIKKIFDKILKIAPGGIYGLLSVAIATITTTTAIIQFPEYSLFKYDVSYLANGPGGIIFNLGLIFSGFIGIFFYIYLGQILKEYQKDNVLRRRAVIIAVISSCAISLIGVFPAYRGNILFLIIHGILAIITFFGTAIFSLFFGLLFKKNSKFLKIQSYFSFFLTIFIGFYVAVRWSILEWITVIVLMIWISFISIYTIYKKY